MNNQTQDIDSFEFIELEILAHSKVMKLKSKNTPLYRFCSHFCQLKLATNISRQHLIIFRISPKGLAMCRAVKSMETAGKNYFNMDAEHKNKAIHKHLQDKSVKKYYQYLISQHTTLTSRIKPHKTSFANNASPKKTSSHKNKAIFKINRIEKSHNKSNHHQVKAQKPQLSRESYQNQLQNKKAQIHQQKHQRHKDMLKRIEINTFQVPMKKLYHHHFNFPKITWYRIKISLLCLVVAYFYIDVAFKLFTTHILGAFFFIILIPIILYIFVHGCNNIHRINLRKRH